MCCLLHKKVSYVSCENVQETKYFVYLSFFSHNQLGLMYVDCRYSTKIN